MVLDNDTRGWIMSCVSGLGELYLDLWHASLTLRFHGSLHRGIEHHLRRSDHPTHPGKTQFPHPEQ